MIDRSQNGRSNEYIYIVQNKQSSDALTRATKQEAFRCLANVASDSDETHGLGWL